MKKVIALSMVLSMGLFAIGCETKTEEAEATPEATATPEAAPTADATASPAVEGAASPAPAVASPEKK